MNEETPELSPAIEDPVLSLSKLAGGLVHEIKNPLSTMNMNLQLLLEDWEGGDSPKEQRTLKKIRILQKEVKRLEGILDDFVRFTRGHRIETEPVPVAALLHELVDFYSPEAAKNGVGVQLSLEPDLPPVEVDRDYLKQALLNLLLNATQAIGRQGQIVLRARRDGDFVAIEVIDDGPGIPPDKLGRIFEAYFSTRRGGSGLGLPLARRIIEEHGGTLTVESEVGQGTDFTIRLPAGRC
ncbi:MAG: ATP-binding protein [Planctomycetota bacterium]